MFQGPGTLKALALRSRPHNLLSSFSCSLDINDTTMPAMREVEILYPDVTLGIPRHEREMSLTTNGLIQIWNDDVALLARVVALLAFGMSECHMERSK